MNPQMMAQQPPQQNPMLAVLGSMGVTPPGYGPPAGQGAPAEFLYGGQQTPYPVPYPGVVAPAMIPPGLSGPAGPEPAMGMPPPPMQPNDPADAIAAITGQQIPYADADADDAAQAGGPIMQAIMQLLGGGGMGPQPPGPPQMPMIPPNQPRF